MYPTPPRSAAQTDTHKKQKYVTQGRPLLRRACRYSRNGGGGGGTERTYGRGHTDATPGREKYRRRGRALDPTAATAPRAALKQGRPFLPGVPYLRVPLGLELVSGAPSFTNFTPEFTELLNYVFIEGGRAGTGGTANSGGGGVLTGATEVAALRVEGEAAVAPMPQEAPLRAVTSGLPSKTFPSDHVSLVVDLELVGVVAGE